MSFIVSHIYCIVVNSSQFTTKSIIATFEKLQTSYRNLASVISHISIARVTGHKIKI